MLLLDTYNILHTRGVLPPRLAGVEIPGLIHLIGRSRYAGRGLRLICDGRRPPIDKAAAMRSGEERVTIGPAEVWYAGAGKDADGLIERILRTDSAARRYLVVSTDRRVRRAASRAGAASIDSATFLKHLADDEETGRASPTPLPEFATAIPLDGYAVRHWIREFGVGEDWLAIRPAPEAAPVQPPPEPPRGPSPAELTGRAGRPRPEAPARAGEPERRPGPDEAWIAEAVRLWGDRLHLDDLDMQKWMKA